MAQKKVVYLFGAGATHAVINALDPSKRLLTSDILEKISENEQEIKGKEIPIEIWNELVNGSIDIEHLISILESNNHNNTAVIIRDYYHQAILEISKEFIKQINSPKYTPNLYSILFDFHLLKDSGEKVLCVLTLNYEDLFEKSLKGHLNIDTDYLITKKIKPKSRRKEVQTIKLHGSFNWVNSKPIKVKDALKISNNDTLWIPPGIDKKRDNYPFNILWGTAFEKLMECDILRVVGSSLSRNDWGLIPMIYTAMRLTNRPNPSFEVEIIDFLDKGIKVKDDYPYLNIKTIIDIQEFKEYIIDIYNLSTENVPEYVKDDISSDASKKINIFEMWLKAKRFSLQNEGKGILSEKGYFESFT